MTSLLLFPFLGLWGLLSLGLLLHAGRRRCALHFVVGQLLALGLSAVVYRQAFTALTGVYGEP